MGTVPKRDARSVSNCSRDDGSYRTKVKGLAVSAAAEIEAFSFVAMKVCQREGTCGDSESLKRSFWFIFCRFGGEDRCNISFRWNLKSDLETFGRRGDGVEAGSLKRRCIFSWLNKEVTAEIDRVRDVF